MNHKLQAAQKQILSDLVIKNGKIIDVFNLQIIEGDVAIKDGTIVGIGQYEGHKTMDAKGRYLAPGFIDSHVHIESSMTTPSQFAKLVVPHGVTTIIADPHEIANVAGAKGIQFMLDDSENTPLDVRIALPSCVPATSFESAGAVLHAKDLKPFYSHPRVIGLGEVMDFPSVANEQPDMMEKLQDATEAQGVIDGHGAGLDTTGINLYCTANIKTDHECTTPEEALNRISRGMYVQIREGSAAKDLQHLIPAVTERNSRRFLLCTDDKHLDEILEEGSINCSVRLATAYGCDPLIAIQMATLNAAECYNLSKKGAIAPGYQGDILLLDDLTEFNVFQVYQNGNLVAQEGQYLAKTPASLPTDLMNSVHINPLRTDDFSIPLQHSLANLINITPNSLITGHLVEDVTVENGAFVPSVALDQLKLAVVERHLGTGNVGLGIVKGFGLKSGAVAASIAHDSHNIMAVGTNDTDLLTAVEALRHMQGGIAVVKDGVVLATLALPVGGLMTVAPVNEIQASLKNIEQALKSLGFSGDFDFLLTLAFLSLPVIPDIKLTHQGLFDAKSFRHIPVQAN